jgi:hypothetical protein
MKTHEPQFLFGLLVAAAAITLACGSSSHIPQSVVVTPPTADAKDFPGGVQFTATASYNSMPSPVKNVSATWTACGTAGSLEPATLVTISSSGVAQCLSGASGNYTVYAFVRNPAFRGACPGSLLCGDSCGGVIGSAQLTCP